LALIEHIVQTRWYIVSYSCPTHPIWTVR